MSGFVETARDAGCRVFVTVTDYDQEADRFEPRIARAILASAEARAAHAVAVASWAQANGFDGVDLDWEAVKAGQRGAFASFVETLARELHRRGLLLAVDVYPKTSEPGCWDGPQAQDWRRLGGAADQFRVMTYNFSGSWSGPGPLSPPAWMDQVVGFAESLVKPGKIMVGVGFYGREWRGTRTDDLTWAGVERLRAERRPRESRDGSGELMLTYERDGGKHMAYFPDAAAVAVKLERVLASSSRRRRDLLLAHGPGGPRRLEGHRRAPALSAAPSQASGSPSQ